MGGNYGKRGADVVDEKEIMLDKVRGCLFGGAVGDALGYPVEFQSAEQIRMQYGENGIQDYELACHKACISDDTQMTLFTANGLLVGFTRLCLRGVMGKWQDYIWMAYKDWLMTQDKKQQTNHLYVKSWLLNVKELHQRRAPGRTCLSALRGSECGSVEYPINSSKGCGGVMRVAPVGLYLPKHIKEIRKVDQIGAEAAALTHGHPLGYIPAAALTHIIARCVFSPGSMDMDQIVEEAIKITAEIYQDNGYRKKFTAIMEKAVWLAHQDRGDWEAIREIGEGWVAEETLAIAVYCAVKYQNDFAKAVTVSVNHDGDSDSTGAVTGNIMGAYLGIKGIPEKYIQPLEIKEVIEEIAVDLFEDCKMSECGEYRDEKWVEKYCTGNYRIYLE
ncbi:MAG: ADP-ribosylglycohydrolase family protein [Lachnospiraceae bacterium]|nr:ADP-ribosylglycohydrolase family protein [Lachnospiraceae bacterium]